MSRWVSLTISTLIFLTCAFFLVIFTWQTFASPYLNLPQPAGGDYFTFLTFTNFFHNHLPFPPTGWLPFWNAGQPLIGSYPWLTFYLIQPLAQFFDTATAMDIFSVACFFLFIFAALILFFLTSRSWLLAATCTIILLLTKTTYYQLATAGLISAASAQFYLPLSLIFTLSHLRSPRPKFILLSGIITGIGLLHHSPTVLLTTFIPQILVLSLFAKSKLSSLGLFLLASLTIGSPAIYTTLLQTFAGSGTDVCSDSQCWGIYPKHLIVWLNPLAPTLVLILLPFSFIKKPSALLPSLAMLLVPICYVLFAYFHLINGPANVIFPIRLFWAGLLFLLLLACSLFYKFKSRFTQISLLIPPILLASIAYYSRLHPFQIPFDRTATVPVNAALYTTPKYHQLPLTDLVPPWIKPTDSSYRLDVFQSGIVAWWNTVSSVPSVRGYANHPVGIQRDWQYFLLSSTRLASPNPPQSSVNQALFLIDHYGISYLENSVSPYPAAITSNPQLISQTAHLRESFWYQLTPDSTSPIIYPTNSPPILFIGTPTDYQLFIRALALTGLTSRTLIPVLGPQQISDADLSKFKILFLYRPLHIDWSLLGRFINHGGQVFLDTVAPPPKIPDFFPVSSLTPSTLSGDWHPGFAPLSYQNGPWRLSFGSGLKPDSESLVALSPQQILISRRKFGSGQLTLSTVNLPYHLVTTQNWPETKLFTQLISSLAPPSAPASAAITRPAPNHITVSGDFSGIYFKENFHSGWRSSQSQIYPAGLNFMYIPTSPGPHQLEIRFTGNATTWFLFLLPIISLVGSIIVFLTPTAHHTRLLKHLHRHTVHRVSKWFESE